MSNDALHVTRRDLILGAGIPTQAGNRFFGEMKFGLGDIPTLKLLVGWNFKI